MGGKWQELCMQEHDSKLMQFAVAMERVVAAKQNNNKIALFVVLVTGPVTRWQQTPNIYSVALEFNAFLHN